MKCKKPFYKHLQWKRIPSGGLQWSQNLTTNFRDSKKCMCSVFFVIYKWPVLPRGSNISEWPKIKTTSHKYTVLAKIIWYMKSTFQIFGTPQNKLVVFIYHSILGSTEYLKSRLHLYTCKYSISCLHSPVYFWEHCIFLRKINCPWHT